MDKENEIKITDAIKVLDRSASEKYRSWVCCIKYFTKLILSVSEWFSNNNNKQQKKTPPQ